jgi:putative heme-binding domain-containing protein
MYWYAAEPLAAVDGPRAARLAFSSPIPRIHEFMARRISSLGPAESLALLVGELGRIGGSAQRATVLSGIEEGLRGRRQVAMPAAWPKVFAALDADPDADVRSRAVALGLTFGDPAARSALAQVLSDDTADVTKRGQALAALLRVKDPALPGTLVGLVRHPQLGGAAIRGLSAYDDSKTPERLLEAYPSLGAAQRRDALNTLAARTGSSRALLAAVEAGRLPRTDLTADVVRQMRNLNDRELSERLVRVWGTIRETTADRARLIASYKEMLTAKPGRSQDRSEGRAIYAKICQQCHTLFGVGGQVGPDLTGSNRAELDYVLSNALDPSALIGKDYLAHVIALADGRVLTGIIRAEDKDTITLVTANETLTIPKSEIEQRRVSEQSMMPEDLWKPLSDQEIRALVAYLASPDQVPLPGEPR